MVHAFYISEIEMGTIGRFEFPGFLLIEQDENQTHIVERGKVAIGDYAVVVTMLRNKQLEHLPFVVASVADLDGKILWEFKNEFFEGVGLLALAAGYPTVALVGRGKGGKVEKILPVVNMIDGIEKLRNLRILIKLKIEAAKFLELNYALTPKENTLWKIDLDRADKAREELRTSEHAAREAARKAKVEQILARPQLTCYTALARELRGYPVVGDEWMSLNTGNMVVLVSSYDDTTKTPGTFIEHFVVQKEHGNKPKKRGAVAIAASKLGTVAGSAKIYSPVGSVMIEKGTEALDVELYASMDDIRGARAAGLNGGTYVAVKPNNPASPLEVLAVYRDRVDSIGHFKPLVE
jgi:hypothetical protein